MDTDLFYLVWRNHFLRKRIRNLIVGNREIKVALSYLNANHQYLSLLDTGHHNIQIKYSIQQKQAFDDYLENPHRHLITQIDFLSFDLTKAITSTDNQQQLPETLKVITFSIIDDIIFNFDHIPRSVEKLELFFCRKVSYLGQIPENIKHLKIDMIDSNKPSENLSLEDLFLEQLVNYKKLEFLKLYGLSLSRPLIIPPWLKDLNLAKMNNIDQYLVISDPSTTRVKFIKEIESKEQLEAINTSQPWCHSLLLSGLPFKLSPGLIPAHITNIDVNGNLSLEKGCLPEGLKKFRSFFLEPLVPCIFPLTLRRMIIDYPNQLDPGVLPLGLEKLYLGKYNHPLSNPTNILPSTITKLILPNYNQPISPGQMPSSLVFLEMREFNKPLVEGALPFGTLEKLSLPIYNHPFPSTACQSDQITLNHIKVFKLDQTITNVISSRITNLQLEFAQKQYPVKLPNSITNLKLEAFGDKAFTGTIKDLLPMHVKFITLTQLTLSPNLIPISCHTLVTDQLDFNRGDIPSNIQYLKIQNFAYRFKEFIEKYSKPDSFDIIPIKNVSLRSELTTLSIKKQ